MQSQTFCYQSLFEHKLKALFSNWSQKINSNTPWHLIKQLEFSAWKRIAIYLALDYIIVPADLIHKLLPDSAFTNALSSFSTILLTIAVYIIPELRASSKK